MSIKLDPELKQKWVTALRSGSYEQARGRLHREGKFCCLGVLANVCGIPPDQMFGYGVLGSFPNAFPAPLQEFIRQDMDRGVQFALERMNDGGGGQPPHSFAQIAAWVEVNL